MLNDLFQFMVLFTGAFSCSPNISFSHYSYFKGVIMFSFIFLMVTRAFSQSFILLPELHLYPLSHFPLLFVFGLCLSCWHLWWSLPGCLPLSVQHWESWWKAFCMWAGLWPSLKVIRQGFYVSWGDPCALIQIQGTSRLLSLLMEMLFRSAWPLLPLRGPSPGCCFTRGLPAVCHLKHHAPLRPLHHCFSP